MGNLSLASLSCGELKGLFWFLNVAFVGQQAEIICKNTHEVIFDVRMKDY